MHEWPRILSVDAATFSESTDMGILKSHLFSAWPRDWLAQLVHGTMPVDVRACSNNWRITRADVLRGSPGHRLPRDPLVAPGTPGGPRRISVGLRARMQPTLNACNDAIVARFQFAGDHALRRWAEAFAPDAVFTFGASTAICKAATTIARALAVPIVPYFTDDWFAYLYKRPPWSWGLRSRLDRWVEAMLEASPVPLSISDLMAAEYTKRFNRPFRTCMDSVDLDRYPSDRVAALKDTPVTFCYVGVMAPNRWKVLRIVAEAIEALRQRGRPCRFHIYTMPADAELYAPVLNLSDEVRIMGSLPYPAVPETQMAADVLVHAEWFAGGLDSARTRLSVSTKIPQYLAAGRAILAVGPRDIASVQYLSATGAAVVVDAPGREQVVREVQRLIDDGALRRELGRCGRAYCERHHTREAMVTRFRQAVEDAVRVRRL